MVTRALPISQGNFLDEIFSISAIISSRHGTELSWHVQDFVYWSEGNLIEVRAWMSNHFPYKTMDVITYPCLADTAGDTPFCQLMMFQLADKYASPGLSGLNKNMNYQITVIQNCAFEI